MLTFCALLKLGLKVIARLTTRLFPEPAAEEEARLTAHWLLVRLPDDPSVPPEPTVPVPASLINCKVFVACVYCR